MTCSYVMGRPACVSMRTSRGLCIFERKLPILLLPLSLHFLRAFACVPARVPARACQPVCLRAWLARSDRARGGLADSTFRVDMRKNAWSGKMASMGHEGGFARSLQGPLAVHFITFGKNNAHLAWRARSDRAGGGVLPTVLGTCTPRL